MKLAVILPSIAGREDVHDGTYDAYNDTIPPEWDVTWVLPSNHPSVGEAWNAGADAVDDADYLMFGIDDAVPHPGWLEVAVKTADAGFIPAPRLTRPDGSVESTGSLGFGQVFTNARDCTPCRNTGLVFIRAEWWPLVGEFLPIHFSADDDWCWRASLHGLRVIYREAFWFTHHHVVDQSVVAKAGAHAREFIAAAESYRYPASARAPIPLEEIPCVSS